MEYAPNTNRQRFRKFVAGCRFAKPKIDCCWMFVSKNGIHLDWSRNLPLSGTLRTYENHQRHTTSWRPATLLSALVALPCPQSSLPAQRYVPHPGAWPRHTSAHRWRWGSSPETAHRWQAHRCPAGYSCGSASGSCLTFQRRPALRFQ